MVDAFKAKWLERVIINISRDGRPVSKEWGIPSFLRQVPAMMENFLGKECYQAYVILNEKEQEEALDYVSNCGVEISELLEIPLWEDWYETPLKPKFENLKEKYPQIYMCLEKGE